FLIALLTGRLKECGIQSMVLSQSFAYVDQPWPNRLKAKLQLAEVLTFLGVRPVLTTEFDLRSRLRTRVLDRLLYFYPSLERCRSGVCRRLFMIYREASHHDEVERSAHDQLYTTRDRRN